MTAAGWILVTDQDIRLGGLRTTEIVAQREDRLALTAVGNECMFIIRIEASEIGIVLIVKRPVDELYRINRPRALLAGNDERGCVGRPLWLETHWLVRPKDIVAHRQARGGIIQQRAPLIKSHHQVIRRVGRIVLVHRDDCASAGDWIEDRGRTIHGAGQDHLRRASGRIVKTGRVG